MKKQNPQTPISAQLEALMEAYRLVVIADEVKSSKHATVLQKNKHFIGLQ